MALVTNVLINLGMSLLTQSVIKRFIVLALEALVKRTANDEDDKLLAIVKDAWKDV